jgi:hypothetical protein
MSKMPFNEPRPEREERHNPGDDYVKINVDIIAAPHGRAAIKVRDSAGVIRWIPRSLIFGPHEKTVRQQEGQLVAIKVFRWFATKNNIPLARDK